MGKRLPRLIAVLGIVAFVAMSSAFAVILNMAHGIEVLYAMVAYAAMACCTFVVIVLALSRARDDF